MKRPRGGSPERLPDPSNPPDERLLALAGQHLKQFGAAQVTVVGIADAAGMTHANVYRYFASKAALIDAVAGQWLKRVETLIAAIADAPDPADDKLERLLQAWARTHRDLLRDDPHLFDVYCAATQTRRAIVRRHRARMRQLTERVLDEGTVTGKFDPRDRDRALLLITDVTFRFINPVSIRLDGEMPDDLADQRMAALIRVVLRALAKGYV
ncbi:TetR/AcrR family transcriptional regulator [Microvirga antarctica]|uniref:TetR/AcrR family transcriptional regulator n=1 Tax=Microvirga antarctica TaxID=2819233 RepID=UPI001B312CE0|nr:TetR/AcrR family transcriptional regulator [Microvirga antarctica]